MKASIPRVEKGLIPFEEVDANAPDYVPKPDEVDEVECEDLDVE